MTRVVGLLDPESAAILTSAVDSITSPRRGGPRFVDPREVDRAERIMADERTTDQIALDALVDMVRVATRAGDTKLFGTRPPAVRLLVTLRDLERRQGVGRIEGQNGAISIASVERQGCEAGYVPILFADDGQSLNLGREQRLHNARQRTVIATRDGGCLWPECERPPGWTEVHHINEFGRGGKTSVEDGVSLCRHHHMLVHNRAWRVRREQGRYWLVPPDDIGDRRAIPLPTKSAAVRRMLATG